MHSSKQLYANIKQANSTFEFSGKLCFFASASFRMRKSEDLCFGILACYQRFLSNRSIHHFHVSFGHVTVYTRLPAGILILRLYASQGGRNPKGSLWRRRRRILQVVETHLWRLWTKQHIDPGAPKLGKTMMGSFLVPGSCWKTRLLKTS